VKNPPGHLKMALKMGNTPRKKMGNPLKWEKKVIPIRKWKENSNEKSRLINVKPKLMES